MLSSEEMATCPRMSVRKRDETEVTAHGSVGQISLLNAPEARNVPKTVTTIIAGSAPTAKLIGDLEQKGINPVHVYGLT